MSAREVAIRILLVDRRNWTVTHYCKKAKEKLLSAMLHSYFEVFVGKAYILIPFEIDDVRFLS